MLQKKRDEFRKQIRRTQLQKFKDKRRKQLFSAQFSSQLFIEIDNKFIRLEQILLATCHKKKQNSLMHHQPQSNYNEPSFQLQQNYNFSDVAQCFQQLKAIASTDYEKVFTKYMMNQKSAQRIMNILMDLVKDQTESQQSDGEIHQTETKYLPIIRNYTIYEIIKFVQTLQFIAMVQTESLLLIVRGIWQVLGEQILFSQNDNYGCLRYTLSILSKIIQDTKNQPVYRYLVQKGIGSQIVKFIDNLRKLQVPLIIHENLLKLIQNYLSCELNSPQTTSDKIGEVTIQTSNVNQKQILLVYCIIFIDRKQQSLYSIVFSCLSKLFQIHEFLVSTLKPQYFVMICNLILHPTNRDIQVQSLALINDATYHSQQSCDQLLRNGFLFDVMHKRVVIQKCTQDQNVTLSVQRIAYIISNALLTQNLPLRRICLDHYIWQQIFLTFHPSNKLFPLITTMGYFFEANGHKNFEKYFLPYLETLHNFEWEQCRYKDSIKQAIMRIFYKAQQQWQEHEYLKLLRIMLSMGFFTMVEDFVDPEDLKQIKGGIQME